MHYPALDPIVVVLGPLVISWYGVSYLAGMTLCWWLGKRRARQPGSGWDSQAVSDLVFYAAVGAVLGGRIGYVFFYGFDRLLSDPLWLFQIWTGGMSFHGGLIGVAAAAWWFGRKTERTIIEIGDFLAPLVAPALGVGRLGNFVNTELPGRKTDSAFGMIYPCSADAIRNINPLCTGQWESFARHPSPLYQAFAEGLVLFVVVWVVSARGREPGVVFGLFLAGYGLLRFGTEFFRLPDSQLGYLAFDWFTMGQLLSIPMVIIGILIAAYGRRLAPPA